MRALMRVVFYCAILALVGLFIWSFLTARTWQEVAEQAQGLTATAAKRANACFEQLRQVSAEENKKAATANPK